MFTSLDLKYVLDGDVHSARAHTHTHPIYVYYKSMCRDEEVLNKGCGTLNPTHYLNTK